MSEPREPIFQIERARNNQWTAHLVASNDEITWNTEQFTTLSKAEESLFHLVDEAIAVLARRSADVGTIPTPNEIPYQLSVAYTRGEREYEPRIAHRPSA